MTCEISAQKVLKNCFFWATTNRHWRQWAHSSWWVSLQALAAWTSRWFLCAFWPLIFSFKFLKNSRKYSPEILGFGLIVGLGPRILTSTVGDNSEVLISKFDFIKISKFKKSQTFGMECFLAFWISGWGWWIAFHTDCTLVYIIVRGNSIFLEYDFSI